MRLQVEGGLGSCAEVQEGRCPVGSGHSRGPSAQAATTRSSSPCLSPPAKCSRMQHVRSQAPCQPDPGPTPLPRAPPGSRSHFTVNNAEPRKKSRCHTGEVRGRGQREQGWQAGARGLYGRPWSRPTARQLTGESQPHLGRGSDLVEQSCIWVGSQQCRARQSHLHGLGGLGHLQPICPPPGTRERTPLPLSAPHC